MHSGGLRTKGITKSSRPGEPLISVVTVVYNGAEEQLKDAALFFAPYTGEIVSVINNFDKIQSYFLSLKFTNYHLVENKQNQGTVKNILSALPFCTGELRGFPLEIYSIMSIP